MNPISLQRGEHDQHSEDLQDTANAFPHFRVTNTKERGAADRESI